MIAQLSRTTWAIQRLESDLQIAADEFEKNVLQQDLDRWQKLNRRIRKSLTMGGVGPTPVVTGRDAIWASGVGLAFAAGVWIQKRRSRLGPTS